MLAAALQGGRQVEQLGGVEPRQGDEIDDRRATEGQRAGLVEDDGVDPARGSSAAPPRMRIPASRRDPCRP